MKIMKIEINRNMNIYIILRPGIDKIRFSGYTINKKYNYKWGL